MSGEAGFSYLYLAQHILWWLSFYWFRLTAIGAYLWRNRFWFTHLACLQGRAHAVMSVSYALMPVSYAEKQFPYAALPCCGQYWEDASRMRASGRYSPRDWRSTFMVFCRLLSTCLYVRPNSSAISLYVLPSTLLMTNICRCDAGKSFRVFRKMSVISSVKICDGSQLSMARL